MLATAGHRQNALAACCVFMAEENPRENFGCSRDPLPLALSPLARGDRLAGMACGEVLDLQQNTHQSNSSGVV